MTSEDLLYHAQITVRIWPSRKIHGAVETVARAAAGVHFLWFRTLSWRRRRLGAMRCPVSPPKYAAQSCALDPDLVARGRRV